MIRSSLLVMLSFAVGCSGSGTDAPPEPVVEQSPTTPPPAAAPGPEEEVPLPVSALTPSPSCGAPGTRVVLRLDWTSDRRVPACVRPDDFDVRFGGKKANMTMLGPTSDGFCALDVVVPDKAESGEVTVKIGRDSFKSPAMFSVPCR